MEKRTLPSFINPREPSIGFDRRYRPRPENQTNLDKLIDSIEEDAETACNSYASTVLSTDSEIPDNIKNIETVSVYLRIRPTEKRSDTISTVNNILKFEIQDQNMEKRFTFTDIFEDKTDQKKVYESTVAPSLKGSLVESTSLSFLTYGTSGSGKTYTLMGESNNLGIIPRAIHQIFSQWRKNISDVPFFKIINNKITMLEDDESHQEKAGVKYYMKQNCGTEIHDENLFSDNLNNSSIIELDSDNEYEEGEDDEDRVSCNIWISFLEIHDEIVRDLLTTGNTKSKEGTLKIISNDGNSYIQGLTSVFVKSKEEAFGLLQFGQKRLHYGSTNVNSNSSRSHSVFIMSIASFTGDHTAEWISYKFCDLAGSERLKKTGNKGVRLKEAQKINSSLLVLGRCLDTIHQNQKKKKQQDIVPVRESKLTFFLQSALLGKEKLTMVVNLLPVDEYYGENLNVLNFSSIAKQIEVPVDAFKRNRSTRYSFFLAKSCNSPRSTEFNNKVLYDELEMLREKNLDLHFDLDNAREEIRNLKIQAVLQEQKIKNEMIEYFESRNDKRNALYERRLEHIRETSGLQYTLQIKAKDEKIKKYDKIIDELEEENENFEKECENLQNENDFLTLKCRLLQQKSKNSKRRMSL